jgi:2-polyprenyl-3-methyl-5-hydroxy-6-metoxy-1,4-benzoquinol methylase
MIPAQHSFEPADIATSSADYAKRFAGEIGEWLIEVQSSFFSSLLLDLSAHTALDVGGGHGQLVEPLSNAHIQVTVLGSDERCKEQLQKLIQNKQCLFKVGSLTQIPEADKSYDLTTCIRFISHCEDWRTLIAELCRVAKQGVIIDYPPLLSGNLLAPITFRIKKLIEGNTRPFSIFTHAEICSEFERHGFTLKKRQGLFFFPMGLHRLLKRRKLSSTLENLAQTVTLRSFLGSPTLALFVPK